MVPKQNNNTLPEYQLLLKVQVRELHLARTVVQTLCTTPLPGNELVLYSEVQGNEHLGEIYLGFIHPTIQGIQNWQGQCKDILVQVPLLISAYTVT